MSNPEYEIYTEVAYYLYQQCFVQAAIDENRRGWPSQLAEAISAEYPDENHLDKKALSDLYGRIKRLRLDNVTQQVMRVSEKTLDLLARYALVVDYKALNRNHTGIPAVYSQKPFGIFNFMRIVNSGSLVNDGNVCSFIGDDQVVLNAKQIISVELYRMPGDTLPLWVKVNFKNDTEQLQSAYFAQIDNNSVKIDFLLPVKLIDFFSLQLKRA